MRRLKRSSYLVPLIFSILFALVGFVPPGNGNRWFDWLSSLLFLLMFFVIRPRQK